MCDGFVIGTQIDGQTGNSPSAFSERDYAGWMQLSAAAPLLILSFRTADQPNKKTSMNRTQTPAARLRSAPLLNLCDDTV